MGEGIFFIIKLIVAHCEINSDKTERLQAKWVGSSPNSFLEAVD